MKIYRESITNNPSTHPSTIFRSIGCHRCHRCPPGRCWRRRTVPERPSSPGTNTSPESPKAPKAPRAALAADPGTSTWDVWGDSCFESGSHRKIYWEFIGNLLGIYWEFIGNWLGIDWELIGKVVLSPIEWNIWHRNSIKYHQIAIALNPRAPTMGSRSWLSASANSSGSRAAADSMVCNRRCKAFFALGRWSAGWCPPVTFVDL